jgi:hypothetical protein
MRDIEPGSTAVSMGFLGAGEANYFNGKRFSCHFNHYETQHFKKSRTQLSVMKYPVRTVVENNFVFDLQKQMDGQFRRTLDAAAIISGQVIKSEPGYTPADLKPLLHAAKNMLLDGPGNGSGEGGDSGGEGGRRATRVIMSESRWNDVTLLDVKDWGNDVSKVTVEGVRDIKRFSDLEVITSINSRTGTGAQGDDNPEVKPQGNGMAASYRSLPNKDPYGSTGAVWPVNSIYVITDPAFLGVNFIMDDVNQKFKIVGSNTLEWWAFCVGGHAIGNARSVVRIDLIP